VRAEDVLAQARADASNERLPSFCMACQREKGWPMCRLCQRLTDAERAPVAVQTERKDAA
jgi:hypothetical protein